MKSGIRTSEFWLAASGVAGILWTFIQQNCQQIDNTKLLILGGLIATYVAGRSWVKAQA